ncbi:4856_t:CDS:2, partial [Cetraspora pellucida]
DIETYSSCGLNELPKVINEEDSVIMICMMLHWKDDSRPLKQICLVDIKTALYLCWITITSNLDLIIRNMIGLSLWKKPISYISLNGYRNRCQEELVRQLLKRLYPCSKVEKESSLKFYLKLCGLESKADMPFNRLYNYYSEAKECSSDITARNMYEVANYCIIDALYCQELVVKCNVINDYREVASIAHVSLFDSYYCANEMKVQNLLGAYAFKHDIVFSTRVRKNIEKEKYPGAYVFSSKKGIEMKRPVTKLDFALLYPSLIMAYNLFSEKIILNEGEADIAQKNKNNLHKIEFLFNDRTLHACCLNSKQFTLKVYMNTFYGKARNSELTGRITSAEQYNINLVTDYITKKSFRIKYGDTDSLYLTCPDEYYKKCDEAFARRELSKEAYWTEMVKITIKIIDNFRNKVNAFLKIKNGTSYLKMAYEEVLFLVCFISKKKYFRVAHKEIVNFKPKKLFTKDIGTVKQGQTELFKFVGEKIIREAMDINNICMINQIVKNTLKEAKYKQWNFGQFIVIATCKPKFSDIAKELNIEIDISHYLEQTVGLCACFINNDKSYQPPSLYKIMQLKDLDKKEKQIDIYSQKRS